jgi:DNA-binding SARP family transcriptional activator
MIHEIATRVSLETFRQRTAGKKIVLLYPWANYRTLFLTHFLANQANGLLYYRIADGQSSLSTWLEGMVQELSSTLGSFGSQLQAALKRHKPKDLGEALAADLGAQASKKTPTTLFVDELDRIPLDNNFTQFMTALVNALPRYTQVAFSSRLLTYQPWYDMVANGDAVILGTEYRKDQMMFTVEKNPRPVLEAYSLGRGYAIVNGQQITNWDGALPRNLFFYFVDRPLVTRDEIFATFWPDLSVKEATNVFHVTKRKISERISMKVDETGSYELTQYSSGFYIPSEKVIRHYDVSDFQAAIERSMTVTDDQEEEQLLVEAIDFYKSPFLETIDMPWVLNRREQLRQLYAQALISMGRLNKRRNNQETALGFFIRSLKETPEREDIHREVMNLYLKLGRAHDAEAQYNHLVKFLRENLSIGPSRESQELYKLIQAAR